MSWMSIQTTGRSCIVLVRIAIHLRLEPCLHLFDRCFCGSTPDPKPPRLATPHSCAGPCSRSRVCSHPCSLPCHPGPCPPCNVTTELPCYCEKQTLSFRCSNLAPSRAGVGANLSCGKPCGRRLACGNHPCENPCHDGPCAPCKVTEVAKCYCEKTERELGCGEGVAKTSSIIENGVKRDWTGRFECEDTCNRYAYISTSLLLKEFLNHFQTF